MRDYTSQSNASPARRRAALEARIPEDRSGCWPWTGTKTAGGYGQMRGGSKVKVYVHRVSYEVFVGPIPSGYHIDHLCRNRICFNPAHLEAVLPVENWRRGESRGALAIKTNKCQRGHELAGSNLFINRTAGHRQCRECFNKAQRDRYHRTKHLRRPA